MGFGGGNLANQDSALIQSLLGQQGMLGNQQANYMSQIPGQDAAITQYYNQITKRMLGETAGQQKKAVHPGIMDFIKTGPQGLANQPVNTGTMGLL